MYWRLETRVEQVTSVFYLKRYKKLREFLHVDDSAEIEKEENKDRLFKVKPLLDAVRTSCLKIEPERIYSIDEQMTPAKIKQSGGLRQHNPKKKTTTHKWGFKKLVRAGQLGMVYGFFIYGGKNDNGGNPFTAEDIVLKLSKDILKNEGFQLYFDNWFSTMELILSLKSFGIFSTATFRTNRLNGCPLSTEKDLKKQSCGSFDYRTDVNTGLHVVKWLDNKCVHLALTFSGVKVEKTVPRWDSKKKQHIQAQCPYIVASYNSSMGGVDLADMLISLYRTKIITKKCWYLRIIFNIVDICKVSGWLLYRRHCK